MHPVLLSDTVRSFIVANIAQGPNITRELSFSNGSELGRNQREC